MEFDLSNIFTNSANTTQNNPTYSWGDFFSPNNKSQIDSDWIPTAMQAASSGAIAPPDFNNVVFTSLPYQVHDTFLANVQGPPEGAKLSRAEGWGFRGIGPEYFKDENNNLYHTNDWRNVRAGNLKDVTWSLPVGSRKQSSLSRAGDMLVPALAGGLLMGGVPALGGIAAQAGLGGTLAGAAGGGVLGNVLGYGGAGGLLSAAQGQDVGKGILSGAVGGLTSSFNPAGRLGIQNKLLQSGVNSAISGTLSGMARGSDFKDALKGAATGAALSTGAAAMDNYFGDLWKNFSGGSDTSLPDLSDNPQMNASYSSDYGNLGNVLRGTQMSFPTPNSDMYQDSTSWLGSIGLPSLSSNPTQNASYGEGYKPPGAGLLEQAGVRGEMSYAPPTANITPDFFQPASISSSGGVPDARPQSFSFPSLNQLGSFAANNAGTLAQMLYGMYNNRRQQRLIGDQIAGLRGLYGQNSPYAQQLRARLNAQAAAGGRRSNTGARETQLQAMLAEQASKLAPSLFEMQMAQNKLRNNNLGIVMGGVRNLKGLGDLFGLGG